MTEEQILEYINNNKPTKLTKCPESGRRLVREWDLGNSTIVETYTYRFGPTHRQSFNVKLIVREEVTNG